MSTTFDCIVVGLGGIGSSAFYFAAKRGWNVMGLDRFPAGHARGSSHGETRIIRQAYFEHPDYVPLALASYELWANLEKESKKSLFQQTGLLQVGHPDGMVIQGLEEASQRHNLPLERFETERLRSEYPLFNVRDQDVGLVEKIAGYLRVEECVRTFIELATACGGKADFDSEVVGWKATPNGFHVETKKTEYATERLIICGGAWASCLLSDLGIELNVIAKHQHWFQFSDERTTLQANCPVFFFEADEGYFYGFPDFDGKGNKIAEHSGGYPVDDPLQVDRELNPLDLQRVQDFSHQYFNSVRPVHCGHSVCMYTMSPDEHFIVDRLNQDRFAFAAGLSGHGFKFAPALGQALVDMVDGSERPDIAFLSSNRFNEHSA